MSATKCYYKLGRPLTDEEGMLEYMRSHDEFGEHRFHWTKASLKRYFRDQERQRHAVLCKRGVTDSRCSLCRKEGLV